MKKRIFAGSMVLLGIGFLALGIAVGELDDAPGAAGLGGLLCCACGYFAYRIGRKR